MEKGVALNLNKLKSPSPKNALCQVWLKLTWWVFRRRFLNFIIVFSLFRNYLPLEKGVSLHLNKFESPSPKDALCQVWLILARWFWRRRFLNFVNVFSLFRILSPLGIWTNFNSLYPRMLCIKFDWNWLGLSGEENFHFFVIISSWKKTCFVPSLVKIGLVGL